MVENHFGHAKIGRLGDLFIEKGLLTPEQVDVVAQEQHVKRMRFGDAAIALGFLTQTQIDAAVGEQFGYSNTDLVRGRASQSLRYFYFPFSKEAEEIRSLRSEILLRFGDEKKIRIALVSPSKAEGKSYMAVSLALALSQIGKRTLLIDADLRSGDLHDYFGLGKPDGLSSVLAGRAVLSEVVLELKENLALLPAGPTTPNPLEILRSPRIQNLLNDCSADYDAVVVDTYAASDASDAQMVAHQTGNALLVARVNQTSLAEMRALYSDMHAAGVDVLGTIYNEWSGSKKMSLSKRVFSAFFNLFRKKKKQHIYH